MRMFDMLVGGESFALNAEARASAPGQFVELADGITHYDLDGPKDAQPVVLVHGYLTPYFTWEYTGEALINAGFRVLRYDLYGRGYSDRPKTMYNAELFGRQLLHLITALDITTPVDLVGFSMGGAISVIFTDRHPTLIRKLGLIAPAGFPRRRALTEYLVHIPVLRELAVHLHYRASKYSERNRVQMQYRGFKRATLSTIRHGPLDRLAHTYQRVGRQQRPTILFWGRKDRTLPFEMYKKVQRAIPHLEFHAIDDAGHAVHHDRPERVNPHLIAFLND